jgi:hypothetical protein
LAILGLACQVLAKEDHMVAMIGGDLGPIAAGLPRGSFTEQVTTLAEIHQGNLELIVMPLATAEALPQAPLPHREDLGNLVVYRA